MVWSSSLDIRMPGEASINLLCKMIGQALQYADVTHAVGVFPRPFRHAFWIDKYGV